ncbi:GSCFA domain-containing protein [Muricoccus radiodurans]|uniref:GSCFA domain-containing protein n=1 Tax=Muricoccus radiodurans TaxID=2231721 RepID=UPI003CEBE813
MSIALFGNCQADRIASLLRVMCQRDDITYVPLTTLRGPQEALDAAVSRAGRVVVHSVFARRIGRSLRQVGRDEADLVTMPEVYFNAFHPDAVYEDGCRRTSAFGRMSSAICLYAWKHGFTPEETVGLYRDETYRALGYYDYWEPAVEALVADGESCGLDLRGRIAAWRATGCFVHAPNHPKPIVLGDIARALAGTLGLDLVIPHPESMLPDPFQQNLVWPVYPEIAARLGVPGGLVFKGGRILSEARLGHELMDLPSFVSRSFAACDALDRDRVTCGRFDDPRYEALHDLRRGRSHPVRRGANPYHGLPDHQFWRRAVAAPAPADLDPVVEARTRVVRDTRIATAGSCFAQHVARHLQASGHHYFIAEAAEGLTPAEAERRNYGVFSARYGNLYTARQLVQLFDRAEGGFVPADEAWRRGERFIDPFRPEIEPEGFASIEALRASREAHFEAVRRLWRELDVFVFTLGLTEAWRARADGAVFPIAPGVVSDSIDPAGYEFHNFSAAEVEADLRGFLDRLLRVNPRARVILTVSPVPLIATYENRHVLVSTTASKSALRVAAEEVCKDLSAVEYFPSYEIITGHYNRGAYFAEDLRSVTEEGVGHVMRVFLRHHAGHRPAAAQARSAPAASHFAREHAAAKAVICEEELLDAGRR